jgi:hypothetical protein
MAAEPPTAAAARTGGAAPPSFLAEAADPRLQPAPGRGQAGPQEQRRQQQQEPQPHKKKAQSKKRKRARRALRLNLRPQIDAVLPRLGEQRVGHATPELVASAAGSAASDRSAGIDWARLPAQLNPLAGKVPPARAQRKRRQIESLLYWACRLLPPPASGCTPTAVDFCAGGGHLGLVLAALRPDITVVLLDLKQPALDGAERRAAAMSLSNVETFCGAVGDWPRGRPFDMALALHSCGGAADAVQAAAIAAGAAYVIAPCCYGFVQAAAEEHAPPSAGSSGGGGGGGGGGNASAAASDVKLLLVADLEYPRSKAYRSVDTLTAAVYAAVAGSADATYWPADARAGEHDGKKRAFFEPFIYKKSTFCQDRLGTNIGKTQKIAVFPQCWHAHAWMRSTGKETRPFKAIYI